MARFTTVRPVQNVRHGWQLFRNRKTLSQMLREVFSGTYRMSALTLVIVIAALAYIISPVDLIPDWIPIIGWIDDGFVLFLLLKRLNKETQRYVRFKAMERRAI